MSNNLKTEILNQRNATLDKAKELIAKDDLYDACQQLVLAYKLDKNLGGTPLGGTIISNIKEFQAQIDFIAGSTKSKTKLNQVYENSIKKAREGIKKKAKQSKILALYEKAIDASNQLGLFDEAIRLIDEWYEYSEKVI
ncbi:MAG: hypothetical protein ACTSR8_10480 [Promethearchaeota archaeon]